MTNVEIATEPTQYERQLVAFDPGELKLAQSNLTHWCEAKVQAIGREKADAERNLETARKAKWTTAPWKIVISRLSRRQEFFRKIKAALDAGYLIIPDLPMTTFAIRTKRNSPIGGESTYQSTTFEQHSEALRIGSGRHVSPMPVLHERQIPVDKNGKPSTKIVYYPYGFQDVDFPMKLVHPTVLDATHRAMALKIFDEIGLVQKDTRKDPIVMGRIRSPQQYGRHVHFFIAWWMDPESL